MENIFGKSFGNTEVTQIQHDDTNTPIQIDYTYTTWHNKYTKTTWGHKYNMCATNTTCAPQIQYGDKITT